MPAFVNSETIYAITRKMRGTRRGTLNEKKAAEPYALRLFDGGDKGIRTPDLRIANATLYQLSHIPIRESRLIMIAYALGECKRFLCLGG